MGKETAFRVPEGRITRWARGQEEFINHLYLPFSNIPAIEYALVKQGDRFQRYLVASHRCDYTKPSAKTAPRVVLGVLHASPGRDYLVDGKVELVVREEADTDESFRVRLRSAASRLKLNPDVIDELRTARKKKRAKK